MKDKARKLRTVLSHKGESRFVLGEYHPNVESVYLDQDSLEKSLKRFGFDPSETFVEDAVAKVKVLCNDGICRRWSRGTDLKHAIETVV